MKSKPTIYIQAYIFVTTNILIQKLPIDFRGINGKVKYWFWFKSMEVLLLPVMKRKANSILKSN